MALKPEERPAVGYQPTPADPAMQRFLAAQRLHALYPGNNPNVRIAIGKLREAVASFNAGDVLHIQVEREQLKHADQVVLPHVSEIRDLANKLYLAHIELVSFETHLGEEEIVTFLELLRMKSDERGPFDEELPARGVSHIQVRESGRVKIVETSEVDPDSWDITSLAEFEELDKQLLGGAGKGAVKEALRAVAAGQDLKRARLLAVLERPAEFAQFLVELASRLKPRSTVDLNAQLALVEALVGQMEGVLTHLPDVDRIRSYGKLDEVVAVLAGGIHRGLLAFPQPPFVRLAGLPSVFPDKVREMALDEALGSGLQPGPGLLPILLDALRRLHGGDSRLSAYLSLMIPPPPVPDPAALAAYRPAPRPAAPANPAALGPDFYAPRSGGAVAAEEKMLAAAARGSVGVIDSLTVLADLMAMEKEPAALSRLVGLVIDRFALALNLRNGILAAGALGALHAERMLKADRPDLAKIAEDGVVRCGEPEMMQLYARMLADTLSGSDDSKRAADLLQSLQPNAISSLIEILAAEALQSTRRKLLDVLATVGRMHFDLIASYLVHPQWYVVRNIVWLLGRVGPEAAGTIRRVSTHRDPRVRREAVRSLAQIGGAEAMKGLLSYLHDKDDQVMREAAAKIAVLRAPEAVAVLHAVVQSPTFADREGETMLTVARALAAIGSAESAVLLDRLAEAKVAKGWLRAPEVKKGLREAAQAVRQRLAPGGKA